MVLGHKLPRTLAPPRTLVPWTLAPIGPSNLCQPIRVFREQGDGNAIYLTAAGGREEKPVYSDYYQNYHDYDDRDHNHYDYDEFSTVLLLDLVVKINNKLSDDLGDDDDDNIHGE